MKELVIIGAGGMGREVYHLAVKCNEGNSEYSIKGFIDDNIHALDGFEYPYPPILNTIKEYLIKSDDVFALSIGDVQTRKRIINYIESRGGRFVSLIDPQSSIETTVKIGYGCIVFHDVHIGTEAVIGNHVMLQSYAALGHDVIIGNFTRIDPKVSCIGGTIIGNSVTLHTMCVINHKVIVEDDAIVGAMSFVIKKVKKGTTVFGVPAKEL